jgi:hypothetical protein
MEVVVRVCEEGIRRYLRMYNGCGWELTLDMNRPKAPPNAKPIPPAMMDFTKQDSIPDCTCSTISDGPICRRLKSTILF